MQSARLLIMYSLGYIKLIPDTLKLKLKNKMDSDTYKKTTETKVDDDGSSKTEVKEKNTATGTDKKTVIEDQPGKSSKEVIEKN